jgi:hypothetical protein
MRAAIALVALMVLVAACGAVGASASHERPELGISNGTTLAVSLIVNGKQLATVEPGGSLSASDAARLPDLPWSVEARSPSGRVLTSMSVGVGAVSSTTDPEGVVHSSGAFGRVDLSCGSLRIWAGFPPSGPIPASPAGSPGDCVP